VLRLLLLLLLLLSLLPAGTRAVLPAALFSPQFIPVAATAAA
jgi:hypothetical protein